jgi:hypothetical protein
MKLFLFLFPFLVLYTISIKAQTPTFADPPGPEHVLVVYNTQSDTSLLVANYYKDARNIPGINVVELSLPSDAMITYQGETHLIELVQQGEIIRDSINQNSSTPTIHAWIYFNERIV